MAVSIRMECRNPRGARAAADVEAVAVGQAAVEHEEPVLVQAHELLGVGDPRGLVAREARPLERAHDERPQPLVVFENQGPACAARSEVVGTSGERAGYQTRPNVFTRKTAICARVFGLSGQYCSGATLQPPVMPEAVELLDPVARTFPGTARR